MLTFDEIVYAGGGKSSNSNYYLNNNATTNSWWTLSPFNFSSSNHGVDSFLVRYNGRLGGYDVPGDNALRPAVSLLSSVQITGGNGTISNPYEIAS